MKYKVASLALVLLLLVVALWQISDVVRDRQNHRQLAVQSVAQSLAGAQTLTGPLIHMACTEEWVGPGPVPASMDAGANAKPSPDLALSTKVRNGYAQRRDFRVLAPPASLNIQGSSQLAPRARGLHATQVFTLKATVTAHWADLDGLKPVPEHAGARLSCGPPLLMMAVSDARGIRHAALVLGGQPLTLMPGTLLDSAPRGVHAIVPPSLLRAAPLDVEMQLELVGTENISIVPIGGDSAVQLSSNWPHPSFGGQFLPVDRKITDQGFEASWRVSSLASTAQQDFAKASDGCYGNDKSAQVGACGVETLGVTFVDPANSYALSDRATKYGLLFIGLTFLAVGLFECMKSLRVHPIQYLLVGAAMCMFFLLLVSLSEHLSFEAAYGIATLACVVLLTYYASHMLGQWTRGLPFGLGIAALYGLLFVLLQLEQTALLVGALALFAVLAAIMLMTRKVDWYARLKQV